MSLTAPPAATERTASVRVVIADDHELIRAGLTRLLAAESDLVVVATASDGQRAVEIVTEHRPDVVLMDLGMPVLDGIEATREIMRTSPSTRVLVLTCFAQELVLENAVAAGAHGYLVKHGSSLEVVDAVRRTHSGEAVFSPRLGSARRFAAARAPRVAALP
jgi:DNA-binding NarL/FixJ family response regulator